MTRLRGEENATFHVAQRPAAELQGFRVYLGDEFCERRLPGRRQLQRAAARCREQGRDLVLATAYLTGRGIAALNRLLCGPAPRGGVDEVVVNDWGALEVVREALPGARLTLGRLLVSHYQTGTAARAGDRSHTRSPGHLFPEAFLKLVCGLGITRLEFNDLGHYQLTRQQLIARGLEGHVYHPYTYTNTTRYCGAPGGYAGYLQAPDEPCKPVCEDTLALMEHSRMARSVLVAGNANFVRRDDPRGEVRPPARVVHNDHLAQPRRRAAGGAR